jgi:NAD(P)-dependent dehydrogenase (short-subunit alcohol dehydrogenase family)
MQHTHTEFADSLAGQVCLVTGGSRGIGAAVAMALAARGARVAVHYGQHRKHAEAVLAELDGDGHRVFGADLSQPQVAAGLFAQVVAQMGQVDVLVNNAGIFVAHPPLTTDAATWQYHWNRTLAVNLQSPANLCHAAAQVMAPRQSGRIINIGSRGAFRGEPHCPAYAASKAGLHALSQSLAVALAPSGILVFAVAPGFVETDMARAVLDGPDGDAVRAQSPFGRVAQPSEVAETVAYLATSAAPFLSGGIFDVNGASYLRS